jgi:5-methyltetrahydrofolate--homocysteine methyltransferase
LIWLKIFKGGNLIMGTKDIFNAVMTFDEEKVKAKTQVELDDGTDISAILNDGLISAMDEVGERFSAGELFVPEMLMAAKAMKSGLEILKPHLTEGTSQSKGTVVIGTVKGDLHDIGKNLVAMMIEGAGFDVVDVGVNVDSGKFVKAAAENNAQIIALSAFAYYHHADHGIDGEGSQGGSDDCQDNNRRGAGHASLCRPNRCRRLQCRCPRRCQAGQAAYEIR